jgi:hypothetical protein
MTTNSNITTPQAAVIIWNYKYRITTEDAHDVDAAPYNNISDPNLADKLGDLHHVSETLVDSPNHASGTLVLSGSDIMRITTQKSKGEPSGSFEILLAPRLNYVGRITPGSWLCIMMSRDKTEEDYKDVHKKKAHKDLVKMLGRIDSVRTMISVDPNTGARVSVYTITGRDWGCALESTMYIDLLTLKDVSSSAIGTAWAFATAASMNTHDEIDKSTGKKYAPITVKRYFDTFLSIWGSNVPPALDPAAYTPGKLGLELKPQAAFNIPAAVRAFFGFKKNTIQTSTNMAEIIKVKEGALQGQDKYIDEGKDPLDAWGFVDPMTLTGAQSLWSILSAHCNEVVNELVADMRWNYDDDPNGQAELTIYRRVRPFIVRSDDSPWIASLKNDPINSHLISRFKHLRTHPITLEDVISVDLGTNWRDQINFLEVIIDVKDNNDNISSIVKLKSQLVDEVAFCREGFRPMFRRTQWIPMKSDGDPVNIAQDMDTYSLSRWKYLLREWYFNTANMFNGSITIVGQNNYIQVGDNIRVDATIMGQGANTIQDESVHKEFGLTPYITAHVEGITHRFSVGVDGARTFNTELLLTRGIITDQEGNLLPMANDGGLDSAANTISRNHILNPNDIFKRTH